MFVDILIFLFLALGLVLGAWRGFTKAIILFFATYIPGLIFIYYYDEISNFVRVILVNSSDANTAFLGGLGIFSGVLALIGFGGGAFLFTRLLMSILSLHKPGTQERVLGAITGFIIQNISATLVFFLIYTALPAETSTAMRGSLWSQIMRPVHQRTYPTYLTYLQERTSRLSASLATNGFRKTLISGVSLGDITGGINGGLTEGISGSDGSIQNVLKQVKDLSKTVDLEAISDLFQNLDTETLSAEEIDKLIAVEDAKRQNALQF